MSILTTKSDCSVCVPGALPGGLVRTRFFNGMFLTQADLENEQVFWRMKRRLTNRALGQGVVWGLRVDWEQAANTFALAPGYALDCCGNDLVVECAQTLNGRDLVAQASATMHDCGKGSAWHAQHCPPEPGDTPQKACLVLQYLECPESPAEVHQNACATDADHCEYSRVRETTRVLLVPPPTKTNTPIEDFCARLEQIREKFEGTEEASTLFPSGSTELDAVPSDLPLLLQLSAVHAASALELRPEVGNDISGGGPNGVLTAPFGTTDAVVKISLSPEAGWGLYQGRAETELGDVIETVTPPLPSSLGWSIDLDVNALPLGATVQEHRFALKDIGVMTLMGNTQLEMSLNLLVHLEIEKRDEGISIAYKALVSVDGPITSATEEEAERTCCKALEDLIFVSDPACTVKTLILAFLYSWLRCLTEKREGKGTEEISRLIYLVAWRVLFGANAGGSSRKVLVQLLNELLQALCEGLMYPGPRCEDEHHGVYLGCVEIVQGRIIRFDPWRHRRYVLTGPLLSHWGQQFGLAPVDVVMGRVAKTLCCIAEPSTRETAAEFSEIGEGSVRGETVEKRIWGPGGRVRFGDAEIFLGNGFDIKDALKDSRYRNIRREKLVSVAALQDLIGRAMTRTGSAKSGSAGVIYSLPAANIHILMPDSEAGETVEANARPIDTSKLPALARKPVTDFANAVLHDTALHTLKAKDSEKILPDIAKANLHSVADLLYAGPEEAARAVGTSSAKLDVVNELFEVAEKLEASLAKAIVSEADEHKGTFVRATLANKEFVKASASAVARHSVHKSAELMDGMLETAARVAGATKVANVKRKKRKEEKPK